MFFEAALVDDPPEMIVKALKATQGKCLLCPKPGAKNFSIDFHDAESNAHIAGFYFKVCQYHARQIKKSPAFRDRIEQAALRYIKLADAEGGSC